MTLSSSTASSWRLASSSEAKRGAGPLESQLKAQAKRLVEGGHARITGEFAVPPVVAQWRELFARYGEK